ncbi:MAG: branched-chain amino acid ABC transporter permease [Betaproteobacteria bacterium]|nr:branched-chain amino acid ABC transporter permease [Betaproteobacteria bacterium]
MNRTLNLVLLAIAIAFPLVAQALDELFYVSFASRILIYAVAATSLNLILGYGGMVSFGHAAFFGAGAYCVGIAMVHGVTSAWITWPLAMVVSALLAWVIGAVCLRTRGVYFIMITLAFAQMMYYIVLGLKAYGGEEGINLLNRSVIGFGVDLKNDVTFYYVCLGVLVAVLYLCQRLVRARFGNVVQAIRENETRMDAIGFPTFQYKLVCFVIAGGVCGLAGALIANQTKFVNPNLLHWPVSGELMIMVILGGLAYLYGGVIGAFVLLFLDELISPYTIFSKLYVGLVLLVIVLFAPHGIAGLIEKWRGTLPRKKDG